MALIDNLLYYYNLNGNSTDVVSANNGTDTSMTYPESSGKIKQGGLFVSGSTSHIDLPTAAGITTTQSWSWWMKTTQVTRSDLINFSNAADNADIFFAPGRTTGGKIDICTYAGVSSLFFTSVKTINDGVWHHLVVTRNSGTFILYIDGTFDNSSGSLDTFSAGLDRWAFGYNRVAGGDPYDGSMDEVGIWSSTLTAADASALYHGGSGLTYPFLSNSVLGNKIRPRAFSPGIAR